jgi:hypothetical protein
VEQVKKEALRKLTKVVKLIRVAEFGLLIGFEVPTLLNLFR